MLTDGAWRDLEPLIEACRPKGKTPPQDLRRTLSAILWRHQNGAKWRATPLTLVRGGGGGRALSGGGAGGAGGGGSGLHPVGARGRLGAPARARAGARGRTRDGVPRRHQHARSPESSRRGPKGGSQAQRDCREALGRSRGGYGTKACVIADASGRAIAFRIAPGQAHELPHAIPLLDQ